jgi:hypothetical protein
MRLNKLKFFEVVVGGLLLAASASAGPVVVVNFDTVPAEPTGPSLFGGPEQDVTVPGVATFTGGTILGFAANFPAIIYATEPNVYGTTNGGPGYLETLTINVDPAFGATEISFPIFNGETFVQSYVATAFDGATQVAQQIFTDVPNNFDSGYALADLIAANITSVTITPVGAPGAFDFVIDTVAFNESVQQAVAPEPGSVMLLGGGLLGLAAFARRRSRK